MAVNARVILFFKQGTAGWSELYWRSGDANIEAAAAKAADLMTERGKILAAEAVLLGYRVSDEDIFKDSLVNDVLLPPIGGQAWESAAAFCCKLVRLQAGARYRRSLFLRGIPIAIVEQEYQDSAIDTAFKGRLNTFRAYLRNAANGWKLRSLDKGPAAGAGTPLTQITNIVRNPLAPTETNISPKPAGMIIGDEVRIYGNKKWPSTTAPLRGLFVVQGLSDDAFSIDFTYPLLTAYGFDRKFRVQQHKFFQITDSVEEGITSRRTGLVFSQ